MTFTSIYLIGAVFGAARGAIEISECKNEINAVKQRVIDAAMQDVKVCVLDREAIEVVCDVMNVAFCGAYITTQAIAWPIRTTYDIYCDMRRAVEAIAEATA
jgi:hypothetical protein